MSFPSADHAGSLPLTPRWVSAPPVAGSVTRWSPRAATSVVPSGDQSTDRNAPRASTTRLPPAAGLTTRLRVDAKAIVRPSGLHVGDQPTPSALARPVARLLTTSSGGGTRGSRR